MRAVLYASAADAAAVVADCRHYMMLPALRAAHAAYCRRQLCYALCR